VRLSVTRGVTSIAAFFLGTKVCFAFALLGPYADWMQQTNGYRWPGDTGGPMKLNEGYRWNVPVITYAFDKAFVDYFGSNGVAAVEAAIQVFNDLPPASSMVLSNYPTEVRRKNFHAEDQWLVDLKSATLAVLLEEMGLAPPTRNIFDLVRFDPIFTWQGDEVSWPPGTIPDLVIERNFDPDSLVPSHRVNGFLYTGNVEQMCIGCPLGEWDVTEYVIDATDPLRTAVADARGIQDWFTRLPYGSYLSGLSRDDVGGLRYLLSTNNINFEILLADVHGAGANPNNYVNGALRPGINKISFLRQQYDLSSGQAVPIINRFTDDYVTNNVHTTQQLERVITRPDILFTAEDLPQIIDPQAHNISGTTNWWNGAAAGGNPGGAGPGVIRPPVKIGLDTFGPVVQSSDYAPWFVASFRWGSFNNSTNPPIAYPEGAVFEGADRLSIHLWMGPDAMHFNEYFHWFAPIPLGKEAWVQTSTNLTDWTSQAAITNFAGTLVWGHLRSLPQGFLRVIRK
jgi:hypothetical protein